MKAGTAACSLSFRACSKKSFCSCKLTRTEFHHPKTWSMSADGPASATDEPFRIPGIHHGTSASKFVNDINEESPTYDHRQPSVKGKLILVRAISLRAESQAQKCQGNPACNVRSTAVSYSSGVWGNGNKKNNSHNNNNNSNSKNRCKTNELCCMCNSLPACLSGTPAFCNSKLWYNLAFPSCNVCLKKALWSYKASVAHAGSAMEVSPVRHAPHTPP